MGRAVLLKHNKFNLFVQSIQKYNSQNIDTLCTCDYNGKRSVNNNGKAEIFSSVRWATIYIRN